MNSLPKSQRLYLRYVLDQLPPEERESVDQALLMDQEFSDSFEEARYDLIDGYAADKVPRDVRRQIEQGILSERHGQRSLALAIAMRKSNAMAAASANHQDWKASIHLIHRAGFKLSLIGSALAACCLFTILWIHVRQGNRSEMRSSMHPGPIPTRESVTPAEPHFTQPTTPSPASPQSPPGAKPRATDLMAFVIPEGLTRGPAQVPLRIRYGIRRIQVQWPLPSDASAATYSLDVSSDGSTVDRIPQHGPLTVVGGVRIATFLVRADRLPDAEYNFRLHDANAGNDAPLAETSVAVSR